MATQRTLLNLQPIDLNPIGIAEFGRASKVPTNTSPHCPPEDITTLQIDVINVLEGRVLITSFDPLYQERIKNYYRFSGTPHLSNYEVIAKRTSDTIDLV